MYPAHMYIIVIFACIGILMKCSALEFYAIAVYGGTSLFDLIRYVPSAIFQLNRDGSSWVGPVLS